MYSIPADACKGQKKVLDNIMEITLQEVDQPDIGSRKQTWNL